MNEEDINFIIQNYEKTEIFITAIQQANSKGYTELEIGKSYKVIGKFETGQMFRIDMGDDNLMYFEYYCFSVDKNQIRKKKLNSL